MLAKASSKYGSYIHTYIEASICTCHIPMHEKQGTKCWIHRTIHRNAEPLNMGVGTLFASNGHEWRIPEKFYIKKK
jgi:hypothetical protein